MGEGLTAEKMRECRWLKPSLVGQFEFVEWTPDGHLRHSRYIGLREDMKAAEVVRETLILRQRNRRGRATISANIGSEKRRTLGGCGLKRRRESRRRHFHESATSRSCGSLLDCRPLNRRLRCIRGRVILLDHYAQCTRRLSSSKKFSRKVRWRSTFISPLSASRAAKAAMCLPSGARSYH